MKLIRRKRGDVFYLKYRLADGRQVQKKLGLAWTEKGRPPVGYFTRRTANDALDAILTDARRGELPGAVRVGATFNEAATEWLAYVEHDRCRRPSTVTDYNGVLRVHLRPEFGDTPLEQIDSAWVDRFRRRLVNGGSAPRTVNKVIGELYAVMARAQRVYGLASNPVAAVERQPVKRSGDFNVLLPVEVAALARAASSDTDAAYFTVAAFAGLRLGEMRALLWSDCDFTNRLIHIRRSYTSGVLGAPKSGKVRSVPMIDQAARALDDLSRRDKFTDPDDLVFCGADGDYMDDSALRRRFKDALNAAGLKRLTLHDLRHSFGTLAVQAFALSDVQAYMGHADIATTMVYVHHVPQIDAADRLSRLVAGEDFVSRNVSRSGDNSKQLEATQDAA